MEDQARLIKKLSRQVRLLNALLVFFTLIFITTIVVAALFAGKAWQKVSSTVDQVDSVRSELQTLGGSTSGSSSSSNSTNTGLDQVCSSTSSYAKAIRTQYPSLCN